MILFLLKLQHILKFPLQLRPFIYILLKGLVDSKKVASSNTGQPSHAIWSHNLVTQVLEASVGEALESNSIELSDHQGDVALF